MRIHDINKYIFIIYDLYYVKNQSESIRDLYQNIKYFNGNWDNAKLKNAIFLILNMILSDGSHQTKYKNEIYNKVNGNWKEFIEMYNEIYDEMIFYLQKDKSYKEVLERDVYPEFTKEWKDELCQMKKVGIHIPVLSSCKFEEGYQYQMPNPPFIPDNDCGSQESKAK